MDIQNCLRELLRNDKTEEDGVQNNYFEMVASKSQESLLCFDGIKILPPLLSDAEKNAMREYRRKAFELEQKLFESKRQKYANLLMKVMDIMDKVQKKKGKMRTSSICYQSRSPSKSCELQGKESVQEGKKTIRETNEDSNNKTYESMKLLLGNSRNTNEKNNLHNEWKWKESKHKVDNDDLPESSYIFQKPKLFNSSFSPRRNKVDSNRISEESDITLNGEKGKITKVLPGLERESSATARSDKIDNNNLPKELGEGREFNAADSLASTVLSIAFTDSSLVSHFSTTEDVVQPSKSAQRQLNMNNIKNNLYQSDHHYVKPVTSTPNDLQSPDIRSSQRLKKKTPVKHASLSSEREIQTEQDRALEKLEIMKRKLLKEKEKQIALLRQQELARLRKNKDHQNPFDLLESDYIPVSSDERDMFSQPHFTSRPASDMYSIPERSFEGSITLTGDDQNEGESASDKENNHYRCDPPQRVYHDVNSVVHYKKDTVEYSSPVKRDIKDEGFISSPYMRQEFLKQFEVARKQGCDGKDKFSILTAHSKGFITRRLLQAEKVQAIIKTIKDTREFLADISREGTSSHQDKTLQQRVQAQMVAAKTKLHDIFFRIPVQDRMAYIAHSRNIAKEREERQYNQGKKSTRRLSAATLKAMQRRSGAHINENLDLKRTASKSPLVKRKSLDTRVLKPVQSTKSPQLQEKGRMLGRRRPGTAPSPRHSIIKKNTYSTRPATSMSTRQSNRKSISCRSAENESSSPHKSARTSLEGKLQMTTKANSKLPVRKSLGGGKGGGLTYRVAKAEEDKAMQVGQPLRLSLEGTSHASSVKQDTGKNTRFKSTTGAMRRTTRSMAAKFNKP